MFRIFTRTLLVGFVFCLMQVVAFGQTPDWKWQNPLPTGNHLRDVHFVDSQTGWAVGDVGTILKTSNGGSSWISQSIATTNRFWSVHFSDVQTGWAVGDLGTIFKTSDGGSTWSNQTSGTAQMLWSVHFIDAQTGWAVGDFGTILKTSNGGSTWSNQTSGTAQMLWSVHFINAQTGWAIGNDGTILKTSNGGSNWSSQTSGTLNSLYSVYFTDAQTGWAVGFGGTILKTSNGGSNWSSQTSGTMRPLISVQFIDAQIGYAVGADGAGIIKTSNGGSSWSSLSSGGTTRITFFSVHFIDTQTGWAVGTGGAILNTSNGGRSWSSQNSGTTRSLVSVQFIDAQTGWAVGSGGVILNTSNGGSSWSSQNSGILQSLTSVHFTDAQTGWAMGNIGTILKTTNGGNSWSSQNSGISQALGSLHFTDAQTGWALVDSNGTFLKTSNGGSSWIIQSIGILQKLSSVYFTDPQTGWVVGNAGTILKTTNGGTNWSSQNSGTTRSLFSVKFIDTQTGWAVGQNGSILKTTNGGSNWSTQSSGTINDLFSIYIADSQTGWAVGDYSSILTTISNNQINPETPTSLLSGSLFEKSGSTCNPNANPISGKLVKADPGPYYAISIQNGHYDLHIPLSDTAVIFTLKSVENFNPTLQFEAVCPPSGQISVRVDTIPDTLSGNDFGFEVTPCHHLDLQLTSNRRRRCFTNSTAIRYHNQGSLPATNSYIVIEFPKWVQPVAASRSFVTVNDSVWQFNLGDVPAGSGGEFSITDSVLCDNVNILGMSQCTKASIYPAPNCPPPTAWSGAEVSVSTRCQGGGFAEVGIYNRTAINMPDSVEYFIYLDSIEVKTGKVKLAAGDSLKYQVENTGYDVHAMAFQVAHHPTQAFVSQSLEGCIATIIQPGGIAMNYAIQQQPNSKTQCLPIIGAYDPNDKQVFPLGFTANRIVPPNTKLEYLVRFQNTGNDTAFTVFIIDTLHSNLNVESFEMGAASHPYQLSMQTTKSGKSWLRWQFNNIRLPDSGTNQLASNGFVQFRISPKANLPLGTQVYNEADIYFDFNPPILTNQTLTTFDIIRFTDTTLNRNVRIILPTGIPAALRNAMKLYPNPVTNNQLNINFAEAASLTLYDARGLTVYSKTNLIGEHTLPVSLKRGMYVARIQSLGGSWSEKVVVE